MGSKNRAQIAALFQKIAEPYAGKVRYKDLKFHVKERKLQEKFAEALTLNNVPHKREELFPGKGTRCDFRTFGPIDTYIEIEWSAILDDGFKSATFADMQKLNDIPLGHWGMFLALNISDKYQLQRSLKWCKDPTHFAVSRKGKTTALLTRWEEAGETDLLKCNPRFWCWPREMGKMIYTVTVLSCFGRLTENGWVPQ